VETCGWLRSRRGLPNPVGCKPSTARWILAHARPSPLKVEPTRQLAEGTPSRSRGAGVTVSPINPSRRSRPRRPQVPRTATLRGGRPNNPPWLRDGDVHPQFIGDTSRHHEEERKLSPAGSMGPPEGRRAPPAACDHVPPGPPACRVAAARPRHRSDQLSAGRSDSTTIPEHPTTPVPARPRLAAHAYVPLCRAAVVTVGASFCSVQRVISERVGYDVQLPACDR
jgi:hypothetical protein